MNIKKFLKSRQFEWLVKETVRRSGLNEGFLRRQLTANLKSGRHYFDSQGMMRINFDIPPYEEYDLEEK